jgi:SAM-dependent methyltransferase
MDSAQRFHDLTEDEWLHVNTDPPAEAAAFLPALPDESTQRRFAGKAGAEALAEGHALARAFKDLYREHAGPITPGTRVLDYGCGWGRITRFFLKDVAGEDLCGIDYNAELIDFCRESNPWARFEVNGELPPTSLPGDHFDLVFAYSVFSHLRQDFHLAWLDELRRLVKPSGLLILTVRPRHFISYCVELSARADSLQGPEVTLVDLFADPEQALADYDAGKYVYAPYRGSSYGEWWGEACIPREYIEKEWTARGLELVDYVVDRERFKQDLVVLRRVD